MASQDSAQEEVIILCLEESETLVEPMCSSEELQQDLVPYVLSFSLQNREFLKLTKPQRQLRVKALTQKLLSGEFSGQPVEAEGDVAPAQQAGSEVSPQRFWAHLRAKYGTRQEQMERFLKLMEPHLRPRRVVVLRFEGEVASPAVSLLVRSSGPCSPTAAEQSSGARRAFAAESFDAAALCAWLSPEDKASKAARPPPLWPQLMAECRKYGEARIQAIILCTEAQSTDTAPEALELAARSLHMDCKALPYLSSVAFGPQSSEHLAALEELCAWAGGLSLNVGDPDSLQPVSEGLAAHIFGGLGCPPGLSERREFYAQKQAIGKCFLKLPEITGPHHRSASSSKIDADIVRALSAANGFEFDGSLPSEAMLAVLCDVSRALQRRWADSLRSWRMHRGLRDVVFSEPGNIGLEFDEPQSAGDPARRSWRLRATHPPASSLKMKEQSELVAINQVRVNHLTPRSEVARRIAARPVSLTFRTPGGGDESTLRFGGAMLALATSEVVVSELREGLSPLKKAAPPLKIALERIAAAKAAASTAGGGRRLQAGRLLGLVAAWSIAEDNGLPSWLHHVSDQALGSSRMKLASAADVLSTVPTLLLCSLLLCGDVVSLARSSQVCCRWRWLVLEGARCPKESGSSVGTAKCDVQRLLWRWVLRWGAGPSSAQRPGFWRWVLNSGRHPDAAVSASIDSATNVSAVLQAALQTDGVGLLELSTGLGSAALGSQLASTMVGRIGSVLNGLPADVLRSLLEEPLYLQRLWLLTSAGLPWLVHQGRCFQVALAAHHPNVFQHLFAEGIAPELFYCIWSQSLLHGLVGDAEIAQLWDLFVFERSHKVLVRAAVAIFVLLEKEILGKNDERIMKKLFDPKSWPLEPGALIAKALDTKVTRSMLRVIAETSVPGACSW